VQLVPYHIEAGPAVESDPGTALDGVAMKQARKYLDIVNLCRTREMKPNDVDHPSERQKKPVGANDVSAI
jgi:hypothetical protein